MLSAGEVFAGRYRIQERLAQGGMGVIYVAEHLATEEQVALKVLWPHVLGSKAAVESFQLEARLNARIGSEHIVRILDAGFDEKSGLPFLSMELLRGATLRALVSRRGPFSPPETIVIMRQVAKALDKAHGHVDRNGNPSPIVHRDLKPENLFLAAREGGAVVKVLDFGIAKVLSQNQGQSQEVRGTPLFMAYEQFTRGPVTPRLDVWALGLIAFYLLTGRKYWLSATNDSAGFAPLLGEILSQPIVSPTERARGLGLSAGWPPDFDDWFAQCVNRNLDARFASAGTAAVALESALTAGAKLSKSEVVAARLDLARRIAPQIDRGPSFGDATHELTSMSLDESSMGVDSGEVSSPSSPASGQPASGQAPNDQPASGQPLSAPSAYAQVDTTVPTSWGEASLPRVEAREPLRSYAGVAVPGGTPPQTVLDPPPSNANRTLPLGAVSSNLPIEAPSSQSRRAVIAWAAVTSALAAGLAVLLILGFTGGLSRGRGGAAAASAVAPPSARSAATAPAMALHDEPKAVEPAPPPVASAEQKTPAPQDTVQGAPAVHETAARAASPAQAGSAEVPKRPKEADLKKAAADLSPPRMGGPEKRPEKPAEPKKPEGSAGAASSSPTRKPPVLLLDEPKSASLDATARSAPKTPPVSSAPPKNNMYDRR
jgi:eukaryotic-like serine/threonine-protein kinase